MTDLSRRSVLKLGVSGLAMMSLPAALGACVIGPIGSTPNADGLLLPAGFTSRKLATSDQVVVGTNFVWPVAPDGGAVFPTISGGWSYVANSESNPGGASFIEFDAAANVINAGAVLTGSSRNCGGGATPWDTWLSCEEWDFGKVWECHPTGAVAAIDRPALGRFQHEAVAVDTDVQKLYLTEDRTDSGLYRFTPDTWGDLSSGTLEVMIEAFGAVGWAVIGDPSGATTETRFQHANTKPFNGGEGIVYANGSVFFATKGDNRIWKYTPATNDLSVLYDDDVAVNGVNGIATGLDNLTANTNGSIFVAEDGGDMQVVLINAAGASQAVVQFADLPGSEVAGIAFDPSGSRMYLSSQRNPGETFEITGPWNQW